MTVKYQKQEECNACNGTGAHDPHEDYSEWEDFMESTLCGCDFEWSLEILINLIFQRLHYSDNYSVTMTMRY